MKLGFKRGEKGFTLIEIIIVLAVLGVLAAVVIPNVQGFLSRGKARGWDADRNILQAAVDGWRTDISNRRGNPWPISDNLTIGVPTDNSTPTDGAANGSFTELHDAKNGIIDISKLSTGAFIRGADSVQSADTDNHLSATNSGGSYVWYIDSNGIVKSYHWADGAWQSGFQTDVYP